MPVYDPTTTVKPTMSSGFNVTVWNNETPAVGSASQKIGLNRDQNFPSAISVEVAFASSPGAFAIDVETADTDAEKYYVTKGTLDAVNAGFVGRLELTTVARFARLKMKARANAVACTAKIS